MSNALWMFLHNYGTVAVSCAATIFVYSRLGPGFAGALAEVAIYLQICNVACGVIRSSMDREIPMAEGQKLPRAAEDVWNHAFWIIAFLTAAGSAGLLLLLRRSRGDADLVNAVLAGMAANVI
ncbi:MAG: hypothetical protein PHQ23_03990, partial [Candidatus Wallbacteria bacterium]|nr:hypothetical protein [Candidatus Wallbacteria bacterium]